MPNSLTRALRTWRVSPSMTKTLPMKGRGAAARGARRRMRASQRAIFGSQTAAAKRPSPTSHAADEPRFAVADSDDHGSLPAREGAVAALRSGERGQRPFQTGSRFSAKARKPSAMSSLA